MVWITFNEPLVLKHLLDQGHVFTVRYYRRNGRTCPVKVGNKFPGIKVKVTTIGSLSDELLNQYYDESGFSSVDEWKAAIERQHTMGDHPFWYILRVEVLQ